MTCPKCKCQFFSCHDKLGLLVSTQPTYLDLSWQLQTLRAAINHFQHIRILTSCSQVTSGLQFSKRNTLQIALLQAGRQLG